MIGQEIAALVCCAVWSKHIFANGSKKSIKTDIICLYLLLPVTKLAAAAGVRCSTSVHVFVYFCASLKMNEGLDRM